jgi:4-oxalomesaconate tautomerase
MRASDFGLVGNESKEELEANTPLKHKVEAIRLQAGYLMNLGDVSQQTTPKMCLVSLPLNGGVINTRMFIPHVVHEAIGVLAAVSVATACVIPNAIIQEFTTDELRMTTDKLIQYGRLSGIRNSKLSIEHPSGEFTVNLDYEFVDNQIVIHKSGVIRTARLLSKGEVFIPELVS